MATALHGSRSRGAGGPREKYFLSATSQLQRRFRDRRRGVYRGPAALSRKSFSAAKPLWPPVESPSHWRWAFWSGNKFVIIIIIITVLLLIVFITTIVIII